MGKKKPFKIRFGEKWFGKFAETLMFDPAGYEYLRWVQKSFSRNPTSERFLSRVEQLLAIGEKPLITATCSCGKPAELIACVRRVDGVAFHDRCCQLCKEDTFGEEFIPLKFSSIRRFRGATDQKSFLQQLRQVVGLKYRERLTVQKAFEIFFPPKPEPPKQHQLL
ncbi:hypothetical protein HQ571_03705 [Candidatus Kuenenbacteria bacterium]|nr:hypothetical protein [Candidatus Kuenenbacteria bacterium]